MQGIQLNTEVWSSEVGAKFWAQAKIDWKLFLQLFLNIHGKIGSKTLCAKYLQSCLTLCDPLDCSSLDSSVHGILQAKVVEWVAIFSSRGSSWPRDQTLTSYLLQWQVDSLPLVPPGKPKTLFNTKSIDAQISYMKWFSSTIDNLLFMDEEPLILKGQL